MQQNATTLLNSGWITRGKQFCSILAWRSVQPTCPPSQFVPTSLCFNDLSECWLPSLPASGLSVSDSTPSAETGNPCLFQLLLVLCCQNLQLQFPPNVFIPKVPKSSTKNNVKLPYFTKTASRRMQRSSPSTILSFSSTSLKCSTVWSLSPLSLTPRTCRFLMKFFLPLLWPLLPSIHPLI